MQWNRDDDIFERAKESVSLVDFLEGFLGERPIRAGENHRFKCCPHCGPDQTHLLMVFDGERYYCHRCQAKGTVIDAAMVAQGLHTPLEAARFLLGEEKMAQASNTARKREYVPTESDEAVRKVIKALAEISATKAPKGVMDYLTGVRGFSEATVQEAIRRRFLLLILGHPKAIADRVTEKVGEDVIKKAGFLGDKGMKIIPYRPLVFPLAHKGSAEFRIARAPREGELKSLTKGAKNHDFWYWKASAGNNKIMICEGAMDVLAAVDLNFQGHLIGLPGVGAFGDEGASIIKAIRAIHENGQDEVFLALDADEAGRKAQAKLSDILSAAGIPHTPIELDPGCKDLGEMLLARKAAQKNAPATPEQPPVQQEQTASTAPAPAPQPTPAPQAATPAPVTPPASAVAEPVAEEAPKPKKPRKPRTASSKPKAPKKKKVEVPTSIFGRLKLAVSILTGRA